MTETPRPVLLAGPTASGKSALALRIAERDGGCIINADAAQVYACWRVLTAAPGPGDLVRAPHRLYRHVSCDERYSVGAWLRDVTAALASARTAGLRPLIVGGTGLYFSALTGGLAEIPPVPARFRVASEALIASGGLDVLLRDLEAGDPETFMQIDRMNPMRVQRAWEVLIATGRSLTDWHRATASPILPPAECIRLVTDVDISLLNRRLADRFDKMIECGALDECRRFLAAGHDRELPAARVLGALPLIAHLEGLTSLEAAIEASVLATRQYAKRQRTWVRNRMADWTRIDPASDAALVSVPEH